MPADLTTTPAYKIIQRYLPAAVSRSSVSMKRNLRPKPRIKFGREMDVENADVTIGVSDHGYGSVETFLTLRYTGSYWKLEISLPEKSHRNFNMAKTYTDATLAFLGMSQYRIAERKGEVKIRDNSVKENYALHAGFYLVIPAGIITTREGA